jgi:hypothetical protein
MAVLEIEPDEYQRVRADGNFLVADGQDTTEIERVVARQVGYAVDDKYSGAVSAARRARGGP